MLAVTMIYPDEILKDAHKHTSQHRALVVAGKCGCFDCLAVFDGTTVVSWVDSGQTALCPHCKIDTVLPAASGLPVEKKEFLQAMYKMWLEPVTPLKPH